MKIVLGSKVKDKVSDLEGIAVARHEFLNGCERISVQQKIDKDGKMPDEKWFDVGQLTVIDAGISEEIAPRKTGGPTSSTVPKGLNN